MTIKDLEQYRQLKKEIVQINESLEQERRIMPIYNKRKKELDARINHCLDKISEIEDFIKTITRSDIRQIIEYRYMRALSWAAVSRRVYGSPSEDRARKAIARFFAEVEQKG